MSVGSISSSPLAAAAYEAALAPGERRTEHADGGRTIADHVAAADDHEPIRSQSATLGTLVDTYL
jgi:hypothetical protein